MSHLPPLRPRISPVQAMALIASLGIVPFAATEPPSPPLPRQSPDPAPWLPPPFYPPVPPKPREATKAELLAAEKRARKAARRGIMR